MADKEFTQICKEILGIGKRLEKIEPEELREIKASIERLSEAFNASKALFDESKNDFDGKYNKVAQIVETFDTLKAQIEEVLKSGVINDDTKGLISTYSSKKIVDLFNEVKRQFVIGGDVAPIISNLDDTTTPTGFYHAVENQTSGTFPQPYGGSRHAHVLVERVDLNWIKQTIVQISQDETKPIFYRTNNLGRGWHPWKEVVTADGYNLDMLKEATSNSSSNTLVRRDANGDFAGRFISAEHFRLKTPTQNNLFGESSEILFRGGASEDANYVRAVSGTYMLKALLGVRGDGIFFQGVNENKGESGQATFGYVRLPGGVLLQFGISHRMNPGETREQYFPVAFPVGCFCVLVSAHMPLPNDGTTAAQDNSHDNTKFIMQNRDANSSMHIAWMAIGV